jgi:putative membrane protein
MLLLHAGAHVEPHELWRHWDAPPIELALLLITGTWYAAGIRALWARAGIGRGISRGRAASFFGGLLALVIALMSPLDAAADSLFSAHMAQHLVLILVAAPLLVSGAPVLAMVSALQPVTARRLGRWWNRRRTLRSVMHGLTGPATAFSLHFIALWFWHLPGPYQEALKSEMIHALEHLSFLGTAALLWWTIAPAHGRPRAREGRAIAVVVGTLMHGGVLGALITFASHPWYPAQSGAVNGLTALEDQQLAGLIMWIPTACVYVVMAGWLFLRWFRADERRMLSYGRGFAATLSSGAVK